VDFAFLLGYLALAILAFIWFRSTACWVITMVAAISIAGGIENLAISFGLHWTRLGLQLLLLLAIAVPAGIAWMRRSQKPWELKRQLLATVLPTAIVIVFVVVLTTMWTSDSAFMHPVSFFMGHSVAEDNAKWLDFTSQLATGLPIDQAVPMGGPLALVMVFMATLMGVISRIALGGYNEVAVAANTVVFAQYFLVAIAPLALAPLVEARLRRKRTEISIPSPFIWLGGLVLAAANLVAIGYGHLTFQYVVLVVSLWSATFLANPNLRRARLLTSITVVIAVTVWFPLNALAVVVLLGCIAVVVGRAITGRGVDSIGLGLLLVTVACVWSPIWSSLSYVLASTPSAAGSGAAGVVSAFVPAGLADSTLFAAGGGTDATGPILAGLAVVALIGALAFLGGKAATNVRAVYLRFAPLILLIGMAMAITILDAWATGGGPHYGALKFTFMASIVVLATGLPIALLWLAPEDGRGISPLQWGAIGIVVFLLCIDTIFPRAVASIRPQQWSPANPFDNARSYWWPADVNGLASQPIATNPVGCVYLPQTAKVPSALLVSQLSDAQRVYACTRLLAGLAGQDAQAQPLVDWLRREWFTNTPAWSDSYDGLASMPESVLNKPLILLDDGSNVVGLDTMNSLLARFPKFAGKTAEELAAINAS